jgi:AraC-like DNA-binding protein
MNAPASLSPRDFEGHTVAAGMLVPLVELVKHWACTPEELLGPSGLSERELVNPQARVPLAVHLAILERARTLTGEPGLGFGWGSQMRISGFGFSGFATLSAATLRDAIELAIQFGPLASTAEGMRLKVEGGVAALILDEHADFGPVRDVALMARLTGLWKMAETLTGRDLRASADIALPEPAYLSRFAHLIPPVRWGQPTTRALLPAEVLDYPLAMASPLALKLAVDQCTRELAAMGTGGRLLRKVRGLLVKEENGEYGFRSAREVAAAAGMSPRTLRRQLTLLGTSLSALLDEERRDRALLLLPQNELSLAEIAGRLGYRHASNFDRAFQRWTGMTPSAYRTAGGRTRPITGR